MRVSGARWLARSGVPVMQIQTFARWVSPTIMSHIGEAHVEDIGALIGLQTSASQLFG